MNNQDQNFTFTLYGAGPLESYMVDNLNRILGNRFVFKGVAGGRDKWAALVKSDIFLLPSRYGEGLPMAMLEAMAVGNVVLVTDDASITYAVENNINGLIVEKYNPADIAEKLHMLLNNPDLLHKLSENAIKTVDQKFNLKHYIEQLESIYGSIG